MIIGEEIWVAVAWFVVLAGIANLLQFRLSVTYKKHWPVFVVLFLGIGVPGIAFTTSLISNPSLYDPLGIAIGLFGIVFYISFMTWWGRYYDITDMYGYKTLKDSYYQLLAPSFTSALSKASEILIQDIVLLIIVTELTSLNFSYLSSGIIFAVFVFLLHIPALKIIGKIYGFLTLVFSTSSAFIIPMIIGEISYGFYFILVMHLSFYASLLVWSRHRKLRLTIDN